MACKNCKYFDENETSGAKGYCEWYKTYVYDDDNCNHYEASNRSGGCYLTTACCEYHGLPDDCYELTLLRKFRDTYLSKCENGQQYIKEYYQIAPVIVKNIAKLPNKDEVYSYIYNTVRECITLIEKEENAEVFELYKQMTIKLKEQFLES